MVSSENNRRWFSPLLIVILFLMTVGIVFQDNLSKLWRGSGNMEEIDESSSSLEEKKLQHNPNRWQEIQGRLCSDFDMRNESLSPMFSGDLNNLSVDEVLLLSRKLACKDQNYVQAQIVLDKILDDKKRSLSKEQLEQAQQLSVDYQMLLEMERSIPHVAQVPEKKIVEDSIDVVKDKKKSSSPPSPALNLHNPNNIVVPPLSPSSQEKSVFGEKNKSKTKSKTKSLISSKKNSDFKLVEKKHKRDKVVLKNPEQSNQIMEMSPESPEATLEQESIGREEGELEKLQDGVSNPEQSNQIMEMSPESPEAALEQESIGREEGELEKLQDGVSNPEQSNQIMEMSPESPEAALGINDYDSRGDLSEKDDFLQFFNEGRALFESRQYPRAKQSFEQALLWQPKHVDAKAYLGRTLFLNGEFDEAMDVVKDAKHLDAEQNHSGVVVSAISLLTMGEIWFERKDYEKAERYLLKYVKDEYDKFPYPYAYYRLGVMAMLHKDWVRAEVCFAKVFSVAKGRFILFPEEFRNTHYNMGLTQKYLHHIPDAKKSFQQALEYDMKYPKALIQLGEMSYKEGQYVEAIDFLKSALSLDVTPSQEYSICLLLGNSWDAWSDEDDPALFTNAFIESNVSKNPLVEERLGKAIQAYEDGLENRPNDFALSYNLSRVYNKLGKNQIALNILESFEKNQDARHDVRYFVELSRTYYALGENEKSLNMARKAKDLDPKNVSVEICLGLNLLKRNMTMSSKDSANDMDDLRAGLEHLERAMFLANNDEIPNAQSMGRIEKLISGLYFELKQEDKAEQKLLEYVKEYPEDASAWYKLGMMRYIMQNYSGAVEAYQKAVALNFDEPKVYFYLARSYHRLHRDQEAKENMDVLRREFPDSEYVKKQ